MSSEIENLNQEKWKNQVAGKLNRKVQMDKKLRKFVVDSFDKASLHSLDEVDCINQSIYAVKQVKFLPAFDKK